MRSLASVALIALTIGSLQGCAETTPGACEGGDPVGPGCTLAPLFEIQVSPNSAAISIGEYVQLVDTVTTTAGSAPRAALWTSSDTLVAKVDSTGRVTGRRASSGVTVCATVSDNGTPVEGCSMIIVFPASSSGPTGAVVR